jgi:hypothetical protein
MRHEIVQLQDGWAGTDATVERIQQIVLDSLQDPVVVLAAHDLVRHLPERDKDAEIAAVSAFVKNKIRYTNEAIETLKTPRVLLDEIKAHGKAIGDCDDHVILWMSLHKVLGSKVRVRVISQRKNGMANHIFGEVWSPRRGWIADELIVKHRPLGWSIPEGQVTKSKRYDDSGVQGLGGFDMANESNVFALSKSGDLFKGKSGFSPRRRGRDGADYFNERSGFPGGKDFFNEQTGLDTQSPKTTDYFGEKKDGGLIPGTSRMMLDLFKVPNTWRHGRQNRPTEFKVKNGGALEVDERGQVSGVGFLPVLAAAAPLVAKLGPIAKMFGGKKKKKKKEPAPAPEPKSCPPGYHMGDYLQVGADDGPDWAGMEDYLQVGGELGKKKRGGFKFGHAKFKKGKRGKKRGHAVASTSSDLHQPPGHQNPAGMEDLYEAGMGQNCLPDTPWLLYGGIAAAAAAAFFFLRKK